MNLRFPPFWIKFSNYQHQCPPTWNALAVNAFILVTQPGAFNLKKDLALTNRALTAITFSAQHLPCFISAGTRRPLPPRFQAIRSRHGEDVMIVRPTPFAVGENPHTGYVASNLDNLLRLAERHAPARSALEESQEPPRQDSGQLGTLSGKIDDLPRPTEHCAVVGVAVACSFEVSENASPTGAVDQPMRSLDLDAPAPVKGSH